jgi:hypothetical protein
VKWTVEFEPGPYYHFPTSPPERVQVERVGLDGVNLSWREQYYLNSGYDVFVNDQIVGHTPDAEFPLRGLDPSNAYKVRVKTVWEDGNASPRAAQTKFSIADLMTDELSLTSIEPRRATGRWRGMEADDELAPLTIHGRSYRGISSFVNAESDFDIHSLFNSFSASVGVEGDSGGDATLEFVVEGDGKELWRSGPVKADEDPKPALVNIAGVRILSLRVVGPERRSRLQAAWVEPHLSRHTMASTGAAP